LFFYLYTIVSVLLYLVALPFLVLLSFKTKYRVSLPARFFLRKNPPLQSGGVWFHSCSFGEAKAIQPLVEALPQEMLRMTTTTQTGKSVTDSYTDQSRYLPFELWLFSWMRPQKVLVVMEAEFWYLLFALAKKKGTRTVLINARMSDRSFPKYQKMRWFYRRVFQYIDEVYAQTETDRQRLELLGAHNVQVTGSLKLAALPKPSRVLDKPEGLIVCGASTHEGEEELILNAFASLRKVCSRARLVLVPRHPERFDKVAGMAESFAGKTGMSMHRYAHQENFESDITVVDMLGELVNIYAVSDIVILGGAFFPAGGHNAAEAAQFGCKIISGPHYFNQRDVFEAIEGMTIVEASALAHRLQQYGVLKPARLKTAGDLTPVLNTIRRVLYPEEKQKGI